MKSPEEMLTRGKGNFFHCTDYETAVDALKEVKKQTQRRVVFWATFGFLLGIIGAMFIIKF